MLLAEYMCVQVVERAVALGAARERAHVLAQDLVVAPTESATPPVVGVFWVRMHWVIGYLHILWYMVLIVGWKI